MYCTILLQETRVGTNASIRANTMNIQPLSPQDKHLPKDPAVELIRAKVSRAFGDDGNNGSDPANEPAATDEIAEVTTIRTPSKHQRYMQELSGSGKSLAEIQTEWHHYYTTLGDDEKHEVWQEFYAANQHTPYQKLFQKQQAIAARKREDAAPAQNPVVMANTANGQAMVVADHTPLALPKTNHHPQLAALGDRVVTKPLGKLSEKVVGKELSGKLAKRVSGNGKLTIKHHLQSLGFGLASGFFVLLVLLFTFFNNYIIAPFIQPSRNVSSTPIILGSSTVSADSPPAVTVPKINIQIPVNFTVASNDETVIEDGLKGGVVHYPSTVMPGQNGNAAYFGHSSGNIFNNGKYKFAFTLLHDLTTGDLFYITYSGQTYAYRIFDREIVPPTDVGVINDTKGKQATATLITCDPPGISTNRLVIWGEQISPAVASNTAPTTTPVAATTPTQLAGNGPTLWSKTVGWLEFWN